MKKLLKGVGIILYCSSISYSQDAQVAGYTHLNPDRIANTVSSFRNESKPINTLDINDTILPDMNWLQQFSNLLSRNIIYPTRGRAYQISGKMYVKFGVDAKGRVHAVAFEQSLGQDFEQAIKEALTKIPPHSEINFPALPLIGHIHFYLPISFKD